MKRRTIIAFSLIIAAASAYQITKPAAVADENGLTVTWTDTAKPLMDVNYTLRGEANVTYGCYTNADSASQNKQVTFQETMKSQAILSADATGKVTGRMGLMIPELKSRLTCPAGQSALLSAISYSDVNLMNNNSAMSHRFEGSFAKVIRPIK